MLTRKQHELLMFIHERMKESGIPPSFDEMKDALDLRSKSGIHRLITALEERGFIRRLPNRARALEVIKLPDSMNPSLGGRKARFEPNVIEGNLGRVAVPPPRSAPQMPGMSDVGRPPSRSWAASRPARPSRRSRRRATPSGYRRRGWAAASTLRSKCVETR